VSLNESEGDTPEVRNNGVALIRTLTPDQRYMDMLRETLDSLSPKLVLRKSRELAEVVRFLNLLIHYISTKTIATRLTDCG